MQYNVAYRRVSRGGGISFSVLFSEHGLPCKIEKQKKSLLDRRPPPPTNSWTRH